MERPIIFSGDMVREILSGRKTMTRRVMKPQPIIDPRKIPRGYCTLHDKKTGEWRSPQHGVFGDRLWVRETWFSSECKKELLGYLADGDNPHNVTYRVRPSIFMPRWASRITLEITDVKVSKLQEMNDEDAVKEGIKGWTNQAAPIDCFMYLWDSINKKYPWKSNPWVWVISFRMVK